MVFSIDPGGSTPREGCCGVIEPGLSAALDGCWSRPYTDGRALTQIAPYRKKLTIWFVLLWWRQALATEGLAAAGLAVTGLAADPGGDEHFRRCHRRSRCVCPSFAPSALPPRPTTPVLCYLTVTSATPSFPSLPRGTRYGVATNTKE